MLKIGVFVSGGGTNLQTIIDKMITKKLDIEITCVISNNKKAYALQRAENYNIPNYCIRKKDFLTTLEYDDCIIKTLKQANCQLIILAGYLSILSEQVIKEYENRIINIHPSLIPSFCGMGFYGLKVHEAVLERGVKITGATVHFVDTSVDGGPIILQKAVEVLDDDTPEILQKRVMEEAEHVICPEAIKLFVENRLVIEDNRVIIK